MLLFDRLRLFLINSFCTPERCHESCVCVCVCVCMCDIFGVPYLKKNALDVLFFEKNS